MRIRETLVCVAVTACLAACSGTSAGSSQSTSAPATSSPSSATSTSAASTRSAPSTSSTPTAAVDTTLRLPFVQWVQLGRFRDGLSGSNGTTEFRTPSGNIACIGLDSSEGVLCQLQHHSYAAEPEPADCHLHWSTDEVSLLHARVYGGFCQGGLVFDPSTITNVLAYGQSEVSDGFACRSESAGLSCVEIASGTGFTVSRDALVKHAQGDTVLLHAAPSTVSAVAGLWGAHNQALQVDANGTATAHYAQYTDTGRDEDSLVVGLAFSSARALEPGVVAVDARVTSVRTKPSWQSSVPRTGDTALYVFAHGVLADPLEHGDNFCGTGAPAGYCGA